MCIIHVIQHLGKFDYFNSLYFKFPLLPAFIKPTFLRMMGGGGGGGRSQIQNCLEALFIKKFCESQLNCYKGQYIKIVTSLDDTSVKAIVYFE